VSKSFKRKHDHFGEHHESPREMAQEILRSKKMKKAAAQRPSKEDYGHFSDQQARQIGNEGKKGHKV
jgi:hypothetical protein